MIDPFQLEHLERAADRAQVVVEELRLLYPWQLVDGRPTPHWRLTRALALRVAIEALCDAAEVGDVALPGAAAELLSALESLK